MKVRIDIIVPSISISDESMKVAGNIWHKIRLYSYTTWLYQKGCKCKAKSVKSRGSVGWNSCFRDIQKQNEGFLLSNTLAFIFSKWNTQKVKM